MNRTYVALDLETTGLDPKRDAILEVGAVRFEVSFADGSVRCEELDHWHSMVNPLRPIPIQIQQLTGIKHEEVIQAPKFSQIGASLRRFLGAHPVVGHNVSFDLGFLTNNDLPLSNSAIDTFELASILMPHAARYSLAKLAATLGLDTRGSHRALEDAQSTRELFTALLDYASQLPAAIVREINRLAQAAKVDWPLAEIFRDMERSQTRAAFRGSIGQQLAERLGGADDGLGPLFSTLQEEGEELTRAAHPRALQVPELAAMLEEGGLFSQHFPGFENRPQQVAMLRAVANAFNDGQHLLVEAGTGTGKSIAYLLPAIAFAHLQQRTGGGLDQHHQPPGPALSQGRSRPAKAAAL